MCKIEDDTDSHLLECVIIKMSNPNLIENSDVKFDYVYSSNMKDVQKIQRYWFKQWEPEKYWNIKKITE